MEDISFIDVPGHVRFLRNMLAGVGGVDACLFVVAATESRDLVHWSGRHIVYRDAMSGTGAGPTESPFVVEHGGRYYLLIGPDWEGLCNRR